MDQADEQQKIRAARLEDIVKEVGNGDLKVTIVNQKIVSIPKQRIDAPSKHGVERDFFVPHTIRLIEA